MVATSRRRAEPSWYEWARRMLGLVIHLSGLALLVFVALGLLEDGSLWLLGRRVEAQVVSTWVEQGAEQEPNPSAYRWFIRYRFTTADGQEVRGVSRVSATELAALGSTRPADIVTTSGEDEFSVDVSSVPEGPTVPVVYFPPVPSHNRLDESRFVSILACAYVPLVLAGAWGLVAGRRLLRKA